MKENKILIVPKTSKYEWDLNRFNYNDEELINFYKRKGRNHEKIVRSHNIQNNCFEKIKNLLKNAKVIKRDDLNKDIADKYDLIIALGGDNHFQYVASFLDSNLILGINSDP